MGHVLEVWDVGDMNYQPMTKEERVAYIQQIIDSGRLGSAGSLSQEHQSRGTHIASAGWKVWQRKSN